MMKKLTMLFISVFMIVSLQIQSQILFTITDDEVLVYITLNEQVKTFVYQNGIETDTYELSHDECGDISDDGLFILLSTAQPSILRIIHLATNKVVFETTWQSNWYPCVALWRGNFIIIRDINSDDPFFRLYFRLENGSLVPHEAPTSPSTITYPNLPDFYPDMLENFILQNPVHQHIYLYEKCRDGNIYEGLYCGFTSMVIYDVSTNQEIEVLEGAFPVYMRGYRVDTTKFDNREPISNQMVAWSPNGRYLAYFNPVRDWPHYTSKVQIYDLQTDSYLNDNEALTMPNITRRFVWTNNNTLIVWKTGLFTELSEYGYHDRSTDFVFANIEEQIFVNGDRPFDVISPEAFFPIDGRAISFVGKELMPYNAPDLGGYPPRGDLIIMSTTTGEHTVIDTDVTEIITWRSICDFTVSDSTSLISTMQTEPYSVICLDENVTYTLTTPLPTITGDITIIGNGAQIVMTGTGRVFDVASTGGLTLKNITV